MTRIIRSLSTWLLLLATFPLLAQNSLVADRSDRSHIVFGYTQWNEATGPMAQYRWNALTHVGYTFVDFDINGNLIASHVTAFNSRTGALKYGGTAQMNGVKVIVVVRNNNFNETILNTVMQSQTLRENLADQIVALVSHPTNGCDGVNLDFEFSWGTTTREGITAFMQYLYPQMKALSPPREVSVYVHPTYNSNYYNVSAIKDLMDYMIYSGYDFATGGHMSAIGRYAGPLVSSSSIIKNCNDYLIAGMPADRMVIALPTYGRSWDTDNPTYNTSNGFNASSTSWVESNFNFTYRSPAYTKLHSNPVQHQGKYYVIPGTGSYSHRLTTFDDAATHEIKLDLARDWKGQTGTGSQLAGVAFWSLGWIGQGNAPGAVNPNDGTNTVNASLRRTHSMPWTLWEEMFSPPGTYEFRAETFEQTSLNPRWVDPKTSPDNVAVAGSTNIASAAAPISAPNGKQRVAALTFGFTNAVNRLLFKFQTLAGTVSPYPMDHNSALVLVDNQTRFTADIHVPVAYANATIRMVVKDGNHQLERGPAFSLATAGWQKISFNLTDSGAVSAYSTLEGGYSSGNGAIDSAGNGERDIAFVGFEISNSSVVNGVINFGEIRYASIPPGGLELDSAEYDVATTMTITVLDSHLAGQGTLQVHATSDLEPAGEMVNLTESAGTGVFTGELLLHYHNPVAADGDLQTQPGNTITVAYNDADDGSGNSLERIETASVRIPQFILESRQADGALTPSSLYLESTGFGSWANTAAKSIAPGLLAPGGRFTGDNSLGAWARYFPPVTVRGYYQVEITLPGHRPGQGTSSFFGFSPGAQFYIQGGAESASGTLNLSQDNLDLADTWYTLSGSFYFDPEQENFIQITNGNPASAGSQRFGMDAVRITLVESHPVPVIVTSWSLE